MSKSRWESGGGGYDEKSWTAKVGNNGNKGNRIVERKWTTQLVNLKRRERPLDEP